MEQLSKERLYVPEKQNMGGHHFNVVSQIRPKCSKSIKTLHTSFVHEPDAQCRITWATLTLVYASGECWNKGVQR